MTTYCLIHGSGQGPAGWQLLVDQLQQRGHRVLTPGFQIDKIEEGATFHASTIVASLNVSGENPKDVVCVGHSASGMYLPLIAEMYQPRQMIFLAALIPIPGVSMFEQAQIQPIFNPAWSGKDPGDEEAALEFVFHDCPPERLEWALSTRICFYAKQTIIEPCPLNTWPDVKAGYIACADDRTITPEWQMKAAHERLSVEPIVLPGGHAPQVSRPLELADALESLTR
ncbi:MAG TPA: alpha/beta hydrolase [Pyrinomonadaceae bacterium]